MLTEIRAHHFPLQEETEKIIGLGIEIHKHLGHGFSEIVYKDALEYELTENSFPYRRERQYDVKYKKAVLPHKFYADFIVFDKVVLEIKAKQNIVDEDYAQVINYLKCSGCEIGLILNFGRSKLGIKRVIFNE